MSLQRTILKNLQGRAGGMLPVGTLWGDCVLDEPGTPYSEFTQALTDLEIKGQVVVVTGEERRKAKITDAGRARLLEQ